MNVLKDPTSAVLTPCAITPRDLTTALVIRDIMEMDGTAKQVIIKFLTSFQLLKESWEEIFHRNRCYGHTNLV